MRAKTTLFLALTAIAMFAIGVGFPGVAKGQTPFAGVTPTPSDFDLTLHVDHIYQTSTLHITDGPSFGQVLVVADTTSVVGSQTLVQTFHLVITTDMKGEATLTMPLAPAAGVTESEALVHAFYADASGNFFETSHWILATKHLSNGHDLETISHGAYDDIQQQLRANILGYSLPPAFGEADSTWVSNAFVLADPGLNTGPLPGLGGPGTWYAAGPIGMYQSSSGPTGVFTAN